MWGILCFQRNSIVRIFPSPFRQTPSRRRTFFSCNQQSQFLLILRIRKRHYVTMYADSCTWHNRAPVQSMEVALSPRKIFVVDDHPLMRRGYKALVQLEPDLSISYEASGGYEALEKLYEIENRLAYHRCFDGGPQWIRSLPGGSRGYGATFLY